MQESVEVRNAKLDAAVACIGDGGTLKIFSSDMPDSCAAKDPGGLLVEIKLPSPCMGKAEDGTQEMSGEWTADAIADGDAVSFRFCTSKGVCCRQGDVSKVGGRGDLILEGIHIYREQTVTVKKFSVTAGNA